MVATRLRDLQSGVSHERGFTLIELLIVIIILGIVAAIVVFAVGATRSDSVVATCKSGVRALQKSAEAVNIKTGDYPPNSDIESSPNPLLAGQAVPDNGAILKDWPDSEDYNLNWNQGEQDVDVFKDIPSAKAKKKPKTVKLGVGIAGCEAL